MTDRPDPIEAAPVPVEAQPNTGAASSSAGSSRRGFIRTAAMVGVPLLLTIYSKPAMAQTQGSAGSAASQGGAAPSPTPPKKKRR